jgi:UDP-4-amino-4,6-dideoxy-N-acetyl-beta-L-altrosamine N-acetyltransferase
MIDAARHESRTPGLANAPWANIRLTPVEESDIDTFHEWQNAPDIRDLTMGFRFPVQKDAVRDWLKGIREQNAGSRVVFAIRNKSALIGTISLHAIDPFQRKSLLGLYIGDSRERNQGAGSVATALLLDYAFNGLDFRKVGLEVLSANDGAVRLYERLGFVREGVKRQDHFIDGKCYDTYLYGMLRDEFAIAIPAEANRLIRRFPD